MGDRDIVLDFSAKLEKILKEKLKATGKSLGKKLQTVKHKLPKSLSQSVSTLTEIRNRAAHEENFLLKSSIDFDRLCHDIDYKLSFIINPPFQIEDILKDLSEEKKLDVFENIWSFNEKEATGRYEELEFLDKKRDVAIVILCYALQDKDIKVANNAFKILSELGVKAKKTIPAILQFIFKQQSSNYPSSSMYFFKLRKESKAFDGVLNILYGNYGSYGQSAEFCLFQLWCLQFLKEHKTLEENLLYRLSCILAEYWKRSYDSRLWVSIFLYRIEENSDMVTLLISSIQVRNSESYNCAIKMLNCLGKEAYKASDVLFALLINEDNENLRYEILHTLSNIQPEKKELFWNIYNLKVKADGNIIDAANSLKKMGKDAKQAIPVLIDRILHLIIEKDEGGRILLCLTKALKEIGNEIIASTIPKIPEDYSASVFLDNALKLAKVIQDPYRKTNALWCVLQTMEMIGQKENSDQLFFEMLKISQEITEQSDKENVWNYILFFIDKKRKKIDGKLSRLLLKIMQDSYSRSTLMRLFLLVCGKMADSWTTEDLVPDMFWEESLQKSQDKELCMFFYIYYGVFCWISNASDNHQIFDQAMQLADKIQDTWIKSETLLMLCKLLLKKGKLLEAVRVQNKIPIDGHQAAALYDIGQFLETTGDSKRANEFYKESEELVEDDEYFFPDTLPSIILIMRNWINIVEIGSELPKGIVSCIGYNTETAELAELLVEMTSLEEEFFDKALEIIEKSGSDNDKVYFWSRLAILANKFYQRK